MSIRPRAFAILLNIVTRQNLINDNVLCFILIYSYRILIFMCIFGYFFQKGNFKGSSNKRAHLQKALVGGADDPQEFFVWKGLHN